MNELADKVAEIMANDMCQSCANCETGCAPGQVVECTRYFLNTLKSIMEGLSN